MPRIVAISDTHERNLNTQWDIPDGDIFIHAGDLTARGSLDSLARMARQISRLPHRYKIMVGGNHDRSLALNDPEIVRKARESLYPHMIYLQDETVEIMGIRFYGFPWLPYHAGVVPEFRCFNLENTYEKIIEIPIDTDVLITHGPPSGILDLARDGDRIGDPALTSTVMYSIMPRVHIFGHCHEGYGRFPFIYNYNFPSQRIDFYNVSGCDADYKPANPATVIDL